MDDPYLDSRSSRRVWEDRPRGPFEVNEPLPKPVQLWKDRTNKATNKPQKLLHFGWQRNAAQRIFESLELHSYEWTIKAIKTRECLDKQDRRDIALSTFAMSRSRTLLPSALALRALRETRTTLLCFLPSPKRTLVCCRSQLLPTKSRTLTVLQRKPTVLLC
jgi:hypothetical protein